MLFKEGFFGRHQTKSLIMENFRDSFVMKLDIHKNHQRINKLEVMPIIFVQIQFNQNFWEQQKFFEPLNLNRLLKFKTVIEPSVEI